MTIQLSGWVRDNSEAPISGATVSAYAATSPGDPGGGALYSTTTDANGHWSITGMTTQAYDVKVDKSGSGFWIKGLSDWNLNTLTIGGTSAPAAGALQVLTSGIQIVAGNLGIGTAPLANYGVLDNVTLTSSAGAAAGISVGATLNAGANNDSLYGVLVNTPIGVGGHTGVSAYGVNVVGPQNATNNYGIFITSPAGGSGDNMGLVAYGDIVLACGGGSQIATNATVGFMYIPSCNGTPTGIPTRYAVGSSTGHYPVVYDTSGHKLWLYDGLWRGVNLT